MKRWHTLLLPFFAFFCCIRDPGPGVTEEVTIRLTVNGPGSVSGFPEDSTVMKGDTLQLMAEADSGAVFTGWDTGTFVTDNPLEFIVDRPFSIRADFAGRPDDMVKIAARDSLFKMGSETALSGEYERPEHGVRFTYDFFIGATEVTRQEFFAVTGSADSEGTGDSLPVTGVTWYDAVLYCNSLSIRDGYDTVYSYTAKCDEPGSCPYVLENLEIHYDRFGYRLPTEAEWEYACRAGEEEEYFWGDDPGDAAEYAWFFDNAGNTLHTVRGRKPNGYGLYDMAGNAAEWVNDWLQFYPDSTCVDPVGPTHMTQEQFEGSWERPLRGGSYRLGTRFLRSATRKGNYEMTHIGTQIDIGFRVALGAFAAPSGVPPVKAGDSLSVEVVCNKSDLLNNFGTSGVKCAFVYLVGMNRYGALADFTGSPVTVGSFGDDSDVVAPSLSPCGNYVAYGSKFEGMSGDGTVTVRALNDSFPVTARFDGFLPRWWVDREKQDTCIVYTDGASYNNQPQWYGEKTFRRRITGGKKSGAPELLWEQGSYHGGLSSNGRLLGTANPMAKLVDLQLNDTNIFYFVPPWNGRPDTPQVCNFSMSPSRAEPGEALFLDFGYSGVSSLVGRSYGFHEILFIANSSLFGEEHISGWFPPPDGYDQWNSTEFSNHPDIIVAVAQTTVEDDDDAVVMLHREDSFTLALLEGKYLRDVSLWLDPAEVSETDDPYRYFGKYNRPEQTAGQRVLAQKLRLFWHEREHIGCVAVGNSPTLYGFDPHHVTVLPALNIGWFQSSIGGSITIAQQYVLPHTPQLRVLLLDLDASYFSVDSRTSIPRLTGLYDSYGYELDMTSDFYRDGLPDAVTAKIAAMGADDWHQFDPCGFQIDSVIGTGWGEAVIEGEDYSIDDSIVRVNIALLEELIDSAGARDVQVVAVNYPQNPGYRDTDMVGRGGPSRSTWLELEEILHGFEEEYHNFHLYDANNLGDHDYTDGEAYDTNHLNGRGGRKLAARIDSLLQNIIE